jgi:hypothetical protein
MEAEELRNRIAGCGHHAWQYAFLKNDTGMDGEIV